MMMIMTRMPGVVTMIMLPRAWQAVAAVHVGRDPGPRSESESAAAAAAGWELGHGGRSLRPHWHWQTDPSDSEFKRAAGGRGTAPASGRVGHRR